MRATLQAPSPALLIALTLLLTAGAGCRDKFQTVDHDHKVIEPEAYHQSFEAETLPGLRTAMPGDVELTSDVLVDELDPREFVIAYARPRAWSQVGPWFEPPASAALSQASRYWVGVACNGSCTLRDWAGPAVRAHIDPVRAAEDLEVTRDEALADGSGHLIIARGQSADGAPRHELRVVRWARVSRAFYHCDVTLVGAGAEAMVSVFERLCTSNRVLFLEHQPPPP